MSLGERFTLSGHRDYERKDRHDHVVRGETKNRLISLSRTKMCIRVHGNIVQSDSRALAQANARARARVIMRSNVEIGDRLTAASHLPSARYMPSKRHGY